MEWKKVLLIEDEDLIREGLKNIIDWESLGMQVMDAKANGKEALRVLAEHRADIIVTDIHMPVMDGLAFLEKLREFDLRARCIILSGFEEFEYARRAVSLDVEEYIVKPIDEEKLVEALLAAAERLHELDKKTASGWVSLLKDKKEQEENSSQTQPLLTLDEDHIRKLLLKKEKEACFLHLEELFVHNFSIHGNGDEIYQLALRMAMFLQEVKKEYGLEKQKGMKNLTELVDAMYEAKDLQSLQTVFTTEMAEMIDCLHENNSPYTPVIQQIIEEVQKNYQEDMNLKTLSYKYHMNTSYLGQIFQKEVGCSFAQYLSNVKNSKAKELLLHTNQKIIDIAKAVGYLDTSYFYRKFKQCYGVSPAAMREMKKY